ncbi:hypothetical protein XENOCAPTIV_008998, partial [Xenoophorus captivus]
ASRRFNDAKVLGYYGHTDRTVIVPESSQVLPGAGLKSITQTRACLPACPIWRITSWTAEAFAGIKGFFCCLERVDFICRDVPPLAPSRPLIQLLTK